MARTSKQPVRRSSGRNLRRSAASGGATRRVRAQGSGKLRRWFGRTLMFGSAFGLLIGLVAWTDPMAKLRELTHRPITGVTVEGEFRYLSQSKTQEMLAERVRGNFLQLDMAELKESLETSPWIDRVSVSRQWPDRLVVRVIEEQPIARWGKSAFMNMRGDIIDVGDNSPLSHLPLLNSDERYAAEVMQKYVQIARLLTPAELGLKEVHLDETLSWTLHLQNDLTIRIGRDQVYEKLQRLLDVWSRELAGRKAAIAGVDLRYDNGFAVAWKQEGLDRLALAQGTLTRK